MGIGLGVMIDNIPKLIISELNGERIVPQKSCDLKKKEKVDGPWLPLPHLGLLQLENRGQA